MFKKYKNIVDKIYKNFNVNLVLCELFGSRWSFVYEAGYFTHGSVNIELDEKYGLIVECNDEVKEKIEEFLKKEL